MQNDLLGTKHHVETISVKEGDSALTFSNLGTCQINDIGQREADLKITGPSDPGTRILKSNLNKLCFGGTVFLT